MKSIGCISRFEDERGGITFVEVLVTFVIVVAAVIATTYAMYFGNRALKVDMHKQQVLQLVEQELEYWIGRMYTGSTNDPNMVEMAGSPTVPYRTFYLDEDSEKQIQVRLYYDPIVPRADASSPGGQEPNVYYVLTVWGEWSEPDGEDFSRANGKAMKLTTYVTKH